MTTEIRLVQFFSLTTGTAEYNFQNYFVNEVKVGAAFAPFQVQGGVSNLSGDNVQIQVLFPTTKEAIQFVEAGDGNRKSRLALSTYEVLEGGSLPADAISIEHYIGIGASFNEDTIELRFNTAADSVAANFPARRLNEGNVGFLPLDSALSLR